MVNKKGFIRIAEVMVAITLILGVILIVYKNRAPEQKTPDFTETARDILREISVKENLRNEIMMAQSDITLMTNTISFINNSLPSYIFFELRACVASSACGQSVYRGNVYSAERIIGADTNNFNPVKLRLFLWTTE